MTARAGVVALALWLAGCTASQNAGFGFATAAPLPVPRQLVKAAVGAEVCDTWYARLARPQPDALLSRAIAGALAQAPGANALADVTLETSSVLLFFWNRSCARVQGDAVAVAPAPEPVPEELAPPPDAADDAPPY